MKYNKYPGYAVKISWWDKLVNWYLNWRYPVKGIGIVSKISKDQKVLDEIYSLSIERLIKSELPPINLK